MAQLGRWRGAAKQSAEENTFATVLGLLFPPIAFTVVVTAMTFRQHFHSSAGMCVPIVAMLAVPLMILRKNAGPAATGPSANAARERSWLVFAAMLSLLAVGCAGLVGTVLWKFYMEPFYGVELMSTYDGIDPGNTSGTRVMDGGIVHFTEGTRLYPAMGMSFTDGDTYCVAPLEPLPSTPSTKSFDFWAVGVGCCKPGSTSFQCGDWNNVDAHGGLRQIGAAKATYFRLAVEQAEAAYGIRAAHPVFFFWMQDPEAAHLGLFAQGFNTWIACNAAHFALNTLLVVTHAVSWRVGTPAG